MNQKQFVMRSSAELSTGDDNSRSVALLRHLLIQVLQQATQGHFLLRERGRVIAEVGDRHDPLQAEVNIIDNRCYLRSLLGGNTGAGEAFVNGWWSSPDITAVTRFFARNLEMMDAWGKRFGWLLKPLSLARLVVRANSKRQAKKNILAHYDLGNDLYMKFLDTRMQYSSAIYAGTDVSLATAQENKLRRLAEQLRLGPQDHLLEIGTGWGGLAIFAAQHYGCRVTTTTISDAQLHYAREQVSRAGLTDRIEVLDQDYRLLEGKYDKIVSVEMIEAVGRKYLPGFFNTLDSLLKPGGLLMLQAITIADQRAKAYSRSEDFIQKHIFPGGYLPSMTLLTEIMASKTELVVRDVYDIGIDYARTLADWKQHFVENMDSIKALGYDDRFCNLWLYYLGYCEGGFLERRISTIQLLASKAPHRASS